MLAAVLAGVSVLAFSRSIPVSYVVFPFLIWAALRFRQLGATSASLLVGAVAVAYTANAVGPFMQASRDDSLLLSQTFVSVAALTALSLAAVTTELLRAERASAERRRRQALEINDSIVQGLAIAGYRIGADDGQSREAIAGTLRRARDLIGQLLDEEGEEIELRAGELRRDVAASVGGTEEGPPGGRHGEDTP